MHHKEVQRASCTVYKISFLDLDDRVMEKGGVTALADVDSCSSSTEVLDKVLNVLEDMNEVTELLVVSKITKLKAS